MKKKSVEKTVRRQTRTSRPASQKKGINIGYCKTTQEAVTERLVLFGLIRAGD